MPLLRIPGFVVDVGTITYHATMSEWGDMYARVAGIGADHVASDTLEGLPGGRVTEVAAGLIGWVTGEYLSPSFPQLFGQ
jgi:hypothetical protein